MTPQLVIGIAGGSGSGKTFFANRLLNYFSEHYISRVSLDNYYWPLDIQVKDEKGVETKIAKLEKNKKKNKKEITSLKRKLTISKKKTTKMEKTFESGDSDKAADFLKDFSK